MYLPHHFPRKIPVELCVCVKLQCHSFLKLNDYNFRLFCSSIFLKLLLFNSDRGHGEVTSNERTASK